MPSGSSKSESSTKNVNKVTDNRIAGGDGSINASGKSKIKIKQTDRSTNIDTGIGSTVASGGGVIVGEGGVSASGKGSTINYLSADVAMKAMETAAALGKAAISASGDSLVTANQTAAQLAANAIENVKESAQSDQTQLVAIIGKYGAWAVGGLVLVLILLRAKK